jgi:peptidoglycan hydrolase-like protein with peptidoglycan-binding domain
LHLRKAIVVVAAGLGCAAGMSGVTTPQKKKPAHHTVAKRKPATHIAKKAPVRSAPAKWHPGQAAPTPERYKEIQEALAKKGYLHGEASGVWNEDSADALRRFQQDQNLQASGKLDSLSIIALGLGPKY